MQNELTVSEAIAAGYQHYGYTNQEGRLFHISDIHQDEDFGVQTSAECFLYAINTSHPFVDPERIEEDIINDTIVNTETDGQEDDIEAAIKKAGINWKEIADKINKELEEVTYYEGTNIKLVP
jgi:hypothetical protein